MVGKDRINIYRLLLPLARINFDKCGDEINYDLIYGCWMLFLCSLIQCKYKYETFTLCKVLGGWTHGLPSGQKGYYKDKCNMVLFVNPSNIIYTFLQIIYNIFSFQEDYWKL